MKNFVALSLLLCCFASTSLFSSEELVENKKGTLCYNVACQCEPCECDPCECNDKNVVEEIEECAQDDCACDGTKINQDNQ